MKIKEIINLLEDFAPLELQAEWDNSGIQVGDTQVEATSALVTLDITEEVVTKAKQIGANIVISHHPLIFGGLRSITPSDPISRAVIQAIKSDIVLYACHTNIDSAYEGVSWSIAKKLKLTNIIPLVDNGMGCLGELESTVTTQQLIKSIKESYNIPSVKINSNPKEQIRKVAVLGGSGASELNNVIASGADAFITADLKYHDFQRAQNRISLIDIGHFESEIDVLDTFMAIIQKKYPNFAIHAQKTSFSQII